LPKSLGPQNRPDDLQQRDNFANTGATAFKGACGLISPQGERIKSGPQNTTSYCENPLMPPALIVLALSSFAIGTTEFVIMGLLPELADDLGVSIPTAGWLVSAYALGVAIGAPFMAMATFRLPRKVALVALMSVFIIGNLLCALAPGYGLLMVARVVTALCHGAFFGIGSVVAASLVAPERKASAIALMFTGLTLANVLGVPLGTLLGQIAGWRATFWAVTLIGMIACAGLILVLPAQSNQTKIDLMRELRALGERTVWLALAATVLFAASMFTLFTYIAPLLRDVTHLSPNGVSWTLLLVGSGLTLGNIMGGRLADRQLIVTLASSFLAIALFCTLFRWTSSALVPAEITLFLWAAATFASVPALQINVVNAGGNAPNLVSTLNISAFNLGNASGAWVGGAVINHTGSLVNVPVAAAGVALLALLPIGAKLWSAQSVAKGALNQRNRRPIAIKDRLNGR
jgi:DHA1 family inner membrane transport protein